MNKDYIIAALVIIIVFLFVSLDNRNKVIESLKEANTEISTSLDDYRAALDEANTNIEDANSQISNAKEYEDTNYEDMSSVLTELYEVDTIPAP